MRLNTNSSIFIAQHVDSTTFETMVGVLNKFFRESDEEYQAYTLNDYRALMLEAQNYLNEIDIGRKIVAASKDQISDYLQTEKFLVQSNVYLRASRPTTDKEQENIGWHRETFYGPNMSASVNIWTPIRGVNLDNTLKYIPESHLIPDSEIITKNSGNKFTEKGSDGHKLGFLYDQKEIIEGVDLTTAEKMIVPYKSSAIFSGNLIHGAAQNFSKEIRFSIDFRIIRKSDYTSEGKKFHLSSGKPYFVEL